MPDVPAAAMALWSVFFALQYLNEGHWKHFAAAILLTLFAGLTKLPALILLAWIVLGLFTKQPNRILTLSGGLVLAIIPCGLYYFYWLPQLVESGAMALMYPTSMSEGLSQVFGSHRSNTIDMFLYRGWGGYLLSILGLLGSALLLIRTPSYINAKPLYVLYAASTLGLLLFAAKSGATLATHPYYAIPFLPLLALGAATLILRSPQKALIYLICTAALIEIGVRHFAKAKQGRALATLTTQVESELPEGPYISGFDLNPLPSYYLDRPTWAWTVDKINDPTLRDAARAEGASGIILPSSDTSRLNFAYEVFEANAYVTLINF